MPPASQRIYFLPLFYPPSVWQRAMSFHILNFSLNCTFGLHGPRQKLGAVESCFLDWDFEQGCTFSVPWGDLAIFLKRFLLSSCEVCFASFSPQGFLETRLE